jgi:hypothetical protein
MEPSSHQSTIPLKCDACGSAKTKSRLIWLNSENGQIYPKVKPIELLISIILMGLSLFWFISTVTNHQNPFLMVISVVFFSTLITVNVIQAQRYLSRKKYEETYFHTCQSCGNQWMEPYEQDPSSPQ